MAQLADYAHPSLACDVVMKGGVTSGLVYPLAVCELAETYRFVNVGGTSAGAIAAAFTAAAECRRQRGDASGFADLGRLPAWLGSSAAHGRSRLLALFAPEPATRPLLDLALAAFGRRTPWRRVARALLALARHHALAGLTAAAPGLLLLVLAARASGLLLAWGLICGFVLAVAGSVAGASLALARRASVSLPENGFGLCSGLTSAGGDTPALAAWLADTLDRLAGQDDPRRPLTFGDLRRAGPDGVHLAMMATSLTHGRPHRLPFDDDRFLFDPSDLRRLFPARIVRFMEEHARSPRNARQAAEWQGSRPLVPLPAPDDLPVVVALRMSLSFPLLLSAVPLWASDHTRRRRVGPDGRREAPAPERCWFSDGGICSNFPVHFFDEPLPLRPTFDLNLRTFHRDYSRSVREDENVWMPRTNRGGVEATWERFDRGSGLARLAAFIGAVFGTMQSWADNSQTRVPGYRDRVVHVFHEPDEGGLNLEMDQATIGRLAERGAAAGRLLRRRFAEGGDGSGLDWDNHRWVRLRSTLALVEETLTELRDALETDARSGAGPSYSDLLARGEEARPRSYRLRSAAQRDFACQAVADLVSLADRWAASGQSLADGAPRPRPELRIRPRE